MRSAGVIGWPVAHSKSPLIHRFWLAKLGLDGDYGRFPVMPEHLGAALRALPALGLAGVNVTVPHKVAALAHLDRVDPLAASVGAVNTVMVEDGRLVGYNTDVAGINDALRQQLADLSQEPKTILYKLIGTGGAARAAAEALSGCEVAVYGRDPVKAAELVDSFGLGGESAYGLSRDIAELAALGPPDEPVGDRSSSRFPQVVINATSLGMTGMPPLTIDLAFFPDDTIVFDMVYAPLETSLLAAARARGLRTVDGLAMLIGQAAAAFALFFGAAAPRVHDAELRALLIGK